MKRVLMRATALAALLFVAFQGRCAQVDEATAKEAAQSFLAKSSVAQRVLAGRAVASVEARGNLWLARLAPSGYIVIAGSTKCQPVLAFSQNDFVEPSESDPSSAGLSGYDMVVAAAMADESAADNAGWENLAQAYTAAAPAARRLLGAPSADTSEVFIAPMLGANWGQGSPMNDLTPRRSPCGCSRGRTGTASLALAVPFREVAHLRPPVLR